MTVKKSKKKTTKKNGEGTPGRPSLLTDDVIEKVSAAISIGSSYALASRYAGISYPTFENWKRLGTEAKSKAEISGEKALSPSERLYLRFLRELEAAEGDAGITWQETVNKTAKIDGNMAMRMLQLRFPGYQSAAQVNYTANIDYTKLTDEQLQRLANGEDPAIVLANSGGGGTGTAPSANTNHASGK